MYTCFSLCSITMLITIKQTIRKVYHLELLLKYELCVYQHNINDLDISNFQVPPECWWGNC